MPFVKGKSGNPNGRPKLPEDVKEIRQVSQVELARLLNKFLTYTPEQLKEHMQDPGTNALELMICRIISVSIKLGDQNRMEYLISRLLGKMKEYNEITGNVRVSLEESMTDDELDRSIAELEAKLQKTTPRKNKAQSKG